MTNISKKRIYNLAQERWEWATNIHSDVLTEEVFIDALSHSYGRLAFFPPYINKKSKNLALYLDGDVYIDSEQYYVYRHIYQVQPVKFHRHLLKLHKIYFTRFLFLSRELHKQKYKFSELPPKRIKKLFTDYMQSFYQLGAIIDIPFMADYALTSILKELLLSKGVAEDKVDRLIFTLSAPRQLSDSAKEKTELRRLVAIIKKKKLLSIFLQTDQLSQLEFWLSEHHPRLFNLLQKHVNKYAYLHLVFFNIKPWSIQLLLQRIKEEIESTSLKSNQPIKTHKEQYLLRKILSYQQIRRLAYYLQSISFIRTWRLERANQGIYFALPFMQEVAKRLQITYRELEYLTREEIVSCFNNGAKINKSLRQAIITRQQGFGVIVNTNYKPLVITKGTLKEFKQFFSQKNKDNNCDIIKGMGAYSGKVRGKVKIVSSPHQASKFQAGNILVTVMTTTDFVPLMEKAGAIITDIGGTTAHAAILARELKKPCIVGTKIATKVLKDGDLVEVDATKGVVKILKK